MESPFYEMSQEFFDDANRQFKNDYARGYSDALLKDNERSGMTCNDKVIKGLIHCTAWNGLHECQPKVGDDCPYVDEADCKLSIMYDALAVLKEQASIIEALKSDLDETLAVLGEQPEIVRCHDCKWWENGFCKSDDVSRKIYDCGCYPDFRTDSDWFCADGERKDDG